MSYRDPRNRRRTERFSAELTVCIYQRGEWMGDYRTRDVSQGGLGLRPGRIMFWRGSRVDIQLFSPSQQRIIARRLPAVVRYCSGHGMGLKFRAGEVPALPRSSRREMR